MSCMGCMGGHKKLLPNTVKANNSVPMYMAGWSAKLKQDGSLGYLGDDGGDDSTDTSDFSTPSVSYGPSPTLDTLASNQDLGLGPGASPTVDGVTLPSWYGTGALETTQAGGGYAPNPGTYGTSSLTSALQSLFGGATNAVLAPGAARPTPTVSAYSTQSTAGLWFNQNAGWLLPLGIVGAVALIAMKK